MLQFRKIFQELSGVEEFKIDFDKVFLTVCANRMRSCVVDRVESIKPDTQPYITQIEKIQEQCIEKLWEKYSDKEKCEEMISLMASYVIAMQDVYAEISLHLAAKLFLQHLDNTKS